MIRIIEGELTTLPVQAVLRPADEHLDPLGGAARRLDAAGGPALSDLRRTREPLEVGSAVITGGGDLAAEFVLHLVIKDEERDVSRETVRRALASAWHRAEAWELKTVAVAVDGLGGNALSIDDGARLLVESFRSRTGSASIPAELQIVVRSTDERAAIAPWIPAE